MSGFTIEDRSGRHWLIITRSRVAFAALALGSIVFAIAGLLLTANQGPVWPAAVIVVLALLAVVLPESWIALMTLATFGAWWLFAVQDVTTPWALPVALALLAFHVAVTNAAAGPPGVSTDPATARTWWRDCVLVAGPTAIAAGVVAIANGSVSTPPTIVGLTMVLLTFFFWASSALTRRPGTSAPGVTPT